MKRMLLGTAAGLLAAVLFIPRPAMAISAESAVVLDSVGSKVLFARQPDKRSLVASTTKIMTGLLVCQRCNVLEQVKIPKEAVGIEGSSLYLKEGEKLTVQELLYGMLLKSGNDAAAALAIHCGGSIEGFAEQMNEKARELGMSGTHFENPHGLDGENHYSTARDLGILGLEAMKNPIFARTVSTKTVRIGDRYLRNHNKLLWRLPGAEGIKTGYTKAAGRILVSSASREGRRFVAVTVNAPDDWRDHEILLEQAFSDCRVEKLISKGEKIGCLEVQGGRKAQVDLLAGEDFSMNARKGEIASVVLPGPGFAYAPVAAGASAGTGIVLINGTAVGRIPAIYGGTVEFPEEKRNFWTWILGGLT